MSENLNNDVTSTYSPSDAPVAPTTAPAKARVKQSLPRLWWGLVVGAIFAALSIAFVIIGEGGIIAALITAVFFFAFGASLTLEDAAVKEVMHWMITRTIAFPGLIWEFSLDGFIWLIGMKLLFWVIGLLFGVLCAILGVIIAIIIAPFAYPFNLISYIREG